MEIRSFTRNELNEFIHSEQYNRLITLPISRHRAISQIRNPRASDTDVLLVAQFSGDRTIGYLGVLPDYLYDHNHPIKIGWLSCFWIDEAYRHGNTAASLFLYVMEAWDYKVLITNFVPSLESLYLRTGLFVSPLVKIGVRCYMRSNLSEILPPKGKWFAKGIPFFRLADFLINLTGDLRFRIFRGYRVSNYKAIPVPHIDQQMAGFINRFKEETWTQRTQNELEWILSNPWIIEKSNPDKDSKRYYFSSISRRFFYRLFRFTVKDDQVVASVLICINNNNLTVPYVYADAGCFDDIAKTIVNTMLSLKLNMVTIFHDELVQSFRRLRYVFLWKKSVKRTFLVSKELGFLNKLLFQDGDGDCAFY